MKSSKLVAMFAVFCLFTGAAQAKFYIGAGIGNSSYEYDDVGNSTGNKIYFGYATEGGVMFEAARVNLGSAKISGTPLELEASGNAFFVGYGSIAATGFGAFGKIGPYSFDTELTDGSDSISESSSGIAWGFGFTYKFSSHVAMRGELESYVGVKDFADDGSITGGFLGLEVRF